MSLPKSDRLRAWAPGMVLWLAGALVACDGGHHETSLRQTGASVVAIETPASLGQPERPRVEFAHAGHSQALAKEGCSACHDKDAAGRISPRLQGARAWTDLDEFGDFYHGLCIQCHQQRLDAAEKTGPVICGGCHLRQPPAESQRVEMRMDNSLHARHVLAEGEKCETCHHIYDEHKKQLVNKSGTESGCGDCHQEQDQGKLLSLRNASHTDCVGCHYQREEAGQAHGPTLCAGCHESKSQAAIEKLAEIPRLQRNQPDQLWIYTPGANSALVAFDHQAHESLTGSCRDCHHLSMQACSSCHSLTGSENGGGVTLEQAFHSIKSGRSCVGCHLQATAKPECMTCHHARVLGNDRQACEVCHNGPAPPSMAQAAQSPDEPLAYLPPTMLSAALAEWFLNPLPLFGEDCPENLSLGAMAKDYQAAKFPHGKILTSLDRLARHSKLANRFHGGMGVFCSGCHHHSPVGRRPPKCGSCHGDTPDPIQDQPDLLGAYHRQCIGCHQQIGHPAQGCEDCHPKAVREEGP